MSRNLLQKICYFCNETPMLVGRPRKITEEDANGYLWAVRGLVVAEAECWLCGAKYLAWLGGIRHYPWPPDPQDGISIMDLSFRSTFDDEPGDMDLPENGWEGIQLEICDMRRKTESEARELAKKRRKST